MASHRINISVLNNPLGIPASDDGVMGIICHATAVSTTFVLDTAYLLTKLADMDTLGIAFSNNQALYQHISEFYGEAGDGAKLWVMGVSDTTAYKTYLASEDFKTFVRGTAIDDPLNMVRVVAVGYKCPTALQTAADFPTDVTDSISVMQTALESLFDEGYQVSGIIDGAQMDGDMTSVTSLTSLATRTSYKVSLCIASSLGNGISSIGLVLGKLARISVGTSIGKVADGSIAANSMFLTNGFAVYPGTNMVNAVVYTVYGGTIVNNSITYNTGDSITGATAHLSFTSSDGGYLVQNSTPVKTLTPTEVNALGDKQYLFCRTWQGKSGYFWNDGATCEAANLALSSLEFNRIANKLSSEALNFFINEIGSNIPVNAKTGYADTGYTLNKEQEFTNTYINPLILSNDISAARITITGANFVATRTLTFKIEIVAAPGLGNVTGTIEFVTTL